MSDRDVPGASGSWAAIAADDSHRPRAPAGEAPYASEDGDAPSGDVPRDAVWAALGRFQRKQGHGLPGASVPFFVILGIATLVYLVSFWLDVVSTPAEPHDRATPGGLLRTLLDQDIDHARNTLGGLGEVMAAVLGLALTVSSIVVQLAATRFTPHVTTLFFRARTNLFVLGFFVTTSVYVLWVNFSLGDQYLPRFGVLFSMLFMTGSLLLLFPYFAYVFDFLDPEKIVGRIMHDGLAAAIPARTDASLPPGSMRIEARRVRVIEAVEHLANIGLNALQQKDKGIASNATDALCELGIRYGASKAGMRAEWHRIPAWNRQSPDFVSLSEEAIRDLERRSTWLEWKILRQYQMLFGEALGSIKDTCYLIAIDTRRLAEAACLRGDLRALDLAIKFFNTYLRASVNAADIRTAYNTLHQYRQLAEFVMVFGHDETPGDRRSPHGPSGPECERRAVHIAKFMRYYGSVSFQRGMPFITEVVAHDLGTLCELAWSRNLHVHRLLLPVFLAVDEHAESKEQEKTLRGVRRAQVKLATTYLLRDAEVHAREIQRDMSEEPRERLRSIWNELHMLETREFWEVNDRGTNFDYLTLAQKSRLEQFFGWFEVPPQHPTRPPSGDPRREREADAQRRENHPKSSETPP